MSIEGRAVDKITVEAVIMREDGTVINLGTIAVYERFTPGRFIKNPRVFISRWYRTGVEYIKQCWLTVVKK